MSELERRLATLTPAQRKLLELRLEKEGLAARDIGEETATPARPLAGDPLAASRPEGGAPRPMAFSLFFFSADGSTRGPKYDLLLNSARFADRRDFTAVWTPERHFQDFGGLYPNPAVLGAALAVVTERLQIRAGSVALPLHHPVRVAEEWAVVDNLSGGRAAISCASGWHPGDFVLRPESFAERKEIMFRSIELIRRLWRGEPVAFPNGKGELERVHSLPRPIQPELPMWVTSSGSSVTWERAGEVGANVLAALGSQPVADLEHKIGRYRRGRRRGGHDRGIVSLMIHTFLGTDADQVEATVRPPLAEYLRAHLRQREGMIEVPGVSSDEHQDMIPLAVEHYLRSASLIGTPETCSARIDALARIGVDEIACLLDFGLAADDVMASLELLSEVAATHRPVVQAGDGQ